MILEVDKWTNSFGYLVIWFFDYLMDRWMDQLLDWLIDWAADWTVDSADDFIK